MKTQIKIVKNIEKLKQNEKTNIIDTEVKGNKVKEDKLVLKT